MGKNFNIILNNIFIEILKHFAFKEKDIHEKIQFIREMAHFSAYNVTGKYSDYEMENELIKIGRGISFTSAIQPSSDTVLHVMTEAYTIGGHTRVVSNWIDFDKERQHSIVFTEQQRAVPDFLKEVVKRSGGNIYFLSSKNMINKAEKLLDIAKNFERIILSVHMYDVVPIIAFSNKNWTTPIYTYNHAEFRFWLGVSISDVVLEVSKEDMKKSLEARGVKCSRLLPIPIKEFSEQNINSSEDSKAILKEKYMIPKEAKIVTSMAQDYKYTVVKNYDFPSFIQKLLEKISDVNVLIIGGDPGDKKWNKLIDSGRVHVLGWLEPNETTKLLGITDLYVDSFPMPSFTSSLEAITKKIPTFSYEVTGYCLDALKPIQCKSYHQLLKRTINILNGKQKYNYENVKYSIEHFHYNKCWIERMEQIFTRKITHRTRQFHSSFYIGEFEQINNAIYTNINAIKKSYFNNLSTRNTIVIKIIAGILRIKI